MTREQFRPPDHPNEHFLLTTTVGSYPKPKWLDRARDLTLDRDSRFGDTAWDEATDDAARLAIDEHERIGLDVVSDGEMRRREMTEYFMRRIDGTTFHGPVKVWGHNYFDKPAVLGEITQAEAWLVDEFEFAQEVATRPVKVPITGPYTLAQFSFNEAYEDTETLAYELAELVGEKIENLVALGARYVQIDEPALAQLPGDYEIVGRCLDRIVTRIPDHVRVGLHVCYGDYSRIYPELLDFPIDEFDVELADGGFDQVDVFTDPEFTKDLAFGVVDAHDDTVESVAQVKQNIKQGLRIVPPRRLTISPDCGLKLLPREVAFQKMVNMVTAAREIERELDSGAIQI